MIITIMGIAFIIAPICTIGFYQSYKEIYRQRDLKELKKSLVIFLNELIYLLSPIEMASKSTFLKSNYPIKKIWEEVHINIINHKELSMEEIWTITIVANQNKTFLNQEDIKNLLDLGKTMGYLDVDAQLANIKILISYIDTSIDEIELSKNQNKKMYQGLSFFASILLIIILL